MKLIYAFICLMIFSCYNIPEPPYPKPDALTMIDDCNFCYSYYCKDGVYVLVNYRKDNGKWNRRDYIDSMCRRGADEATDDYNCFIKYTK